MLNTQTLLPYTLSSMALLVMLSVGCTQNRVLNFGNQTDCADTIGSACDVTDVYAQQATAIEYPAVSNATLEATGSSAYSAKPRSLADLDEVAYRNLRLEEVIQLGLQHATVLRDLGGTVVSSPEGATTIYDPATRETDPSLGVDAALSAFDAQFTTSLFNEKNDRALNNEFFGGGTRLLTQDSSVWQTQLAKRSVAGTQMSLRHITEFDSNNAPGNLFNSAWTTKLEAEVRQPLLQGNGMRFNRIAGPSQTPGNYNGVMIARLNTDKELAEFEAAVRDYVSNVENAYWDLYYAYRDLDARIAARDSALDTWRRVKALNESGRRGGEAEKEAQAREQYYRFEEEVQNALSGKPIDGTRTGGGSAGGSFRASGGVFVSERRLRRLLGLAASDGELIRPSLDPIVAQVTFDWDEVNAEAIERRAELRRQRWQIRQRELELIASKNFLRPRLDVVGRYRLRGFGDDLLDSSGDNLRFDNSYEDLTSGDFQEWQLGFELDVPIGFRRAHSAARNAELMLARERALLEDQQRGVVHQVADAVSELDRAFLVSQTSYNRLIASKEQLAAVEAAFDNDKAPLDLLLEAQRKRAEADSRYYRGLVEYAIALKNVHYAKGSLLEFDGVHLAEGSWPCKAYTDASKLRSLRGERNPLNYASQHAPVVSRGEYPQNQMPMTYAPGVTAHGIGAPEVNGPGVGGPESAPQGMPQEVIREEFGPIPSAPASLGISEPTPLPAPSASIKNPKQVKRAESWLFGTDASASLANPENESTNSVR